MCHHAPTSNLVAVAAVARAEIKKDLQALTLAEPTKYPVDVLHVVHFVTIFLFSTHPGENEIHVK